MSKETFEITEEIGIVRVDKHLANLFPEYSRSALAKLFLIKLIKFKGEPIEPGYKLRPGAVVEYDLGPLQEKPDVIPLPIIYEDDNVLVVDKPAGIISHARGKFWQEASVASFLRDYVVKQASANTSQSSHSDADSALFDTDTETATSKSENSTDTITDSREPDGAVRALRAGIVHRLDRATSGVMICAKNEDTLKFLQKQFHDRKVQKTYIAIIDHMPKEPTAIIDAPIGRNPNDPKTFHVRSDGKSAETRYEVIDESPNRMTVKLSPKTGRTHQLRVHMQYINCPIIGDHLYKGLAHDRLLLHAHTLELAMPGGEIKTFTAPIPSEFENIA